MLNFDTLDYPYSSRRNVIASSRGMVATTQPQAAQAGLEMLYQGGNAIDAAIATAICLTVLEPTSNGLGSDAFALVWSGNKLHGLNSSGPAPGNISIEKLKEKGLEEIPAWGSLPVTVPGAVRGWKELSKRFGRLPFSRLFEPAEKYAREGFPVSPEVSRNWQRACQIFSERLKSEEFKPWFETFSFNNKGPSPGQIWKSEEMARTLQKIAESDAQSFYDGDIAEKIASFVQKHGGYLNEKDLIGFKPEWVDPIGIEYRGYSIWEIPPNGQGLVALMALNILNQLKRDYSKPELMYHQEIEALKLALTDGLTYITDQKEMEPQPEFFLSSEYSQKRSDLIAENATDPRPITPPGGGTVYLAAADNDGNMVSFIQSNFMGFGSGMVVPGTGISLQNRGYSFKLDPKHPNALAGGKKTFHTIIPGFITKGNRPVGPFGVMGGYMQTQGHLQIIRNLVELGLNPQSALDAPRWQWIKGKEVALEKDFPENLALNLKRRGHQIDLRLERGSFGRGQIIIQNEDGVLLGGTEPRADGHIATF